MSFGMSEKSDGPEVTSKAEDLLPCPFCGTTELLSVEEISRTDRATFNKNGVRRKRADISHRVVCYECGATGRSSIYFLEQIELREIDITDSFDTAKLYWNTRAPISNRVFSLINKMIADAFKIVDER
jgi:hypothetical protein